VKGWSAKLPECNFVSISYSKVTDEYAKELFKWKLKNRGVKMLLEIEDISNNFIKTLIKDLTEYGFDGCIIRNAKEQDVQIINNLQMSLSRLPPPYDFGWEIFIEIGSNTKVIRTFSINKPTTKYIVKSQYVKALTDDNTSPMNIIVDNDIEYMMYHKLGGAWITSENINLDTVLKSKDKLKVHENHIEYPSSQVLKGISIRHNLSVKLSLSFK
jgi:hypothetical protein